MSNITTLTLQHQDGVPPYVLYLMYFVAVVLPKLEVVLSTFMIVLGTSLLTVGVYRFQQKASKFVHDYIPLETMPSSKSDQHSNL
jgi:hypothetical protein